MAKKPSTQGASRPVKAIKKPLAKPRKTDTKPKPAKLEKPRKSDRKKAIAMAEAVHNVLEAVQNGTMGRPTDYRPEYAVLAEKLCLLNVGVTDKDLADFFEVCEKTINNWKNAHPEFLQSIRAGKTLADANVAHALYRRATGATFIIEKEVKRKVIEYDPANPGKKLSEEEFIEVVPLIQEAPPDPTAAKYWLNNRDPERWRERVEAVPPPPPPPTATDVLTLGFARRLAFMLEKAARLADMKNVTPAAEDGPTVAE